MSTSLPVISPLLKQQELKLKSRRDYLITKHSELLTQLENKYQQHINQLLVQKAKCQKELESQFMHQLQHINNTLFSIQSQLPSPSPIEPMHCTPPNTTSYPLTIENEDKKSECNLNDEDDDLQGNNLQLESEIIDSNPLNININSIQCDNIPYIVSSIHNDINANIDQIDPIHTTENLIFQSPKTNINKSVIETPETDKNRQLIYEKTLKVMRSIERDKKKNNRNNKNEKKRRKKRRKKKRKEQNEIIKGNNRMSKKRKYIENIDDSVHHRVNKRRKISNECNTMRRCSSLTSLFSRSVIDINKKNAKKPPRKVVSCRFRRSSLAYL